MDRELEVHVELSGTTSLVGRLWSRSIRGRESATFEYDPDWLRSDFRFPLAPLLSMDAGRHHTEAGKAIFGAIGDSAPDRWGRALMRRAERRTANRSSRDPRTLLEIDYLLMVDDALRQLEKSGEAERLFFKWYGPNSKVKFDKRTFKIDSDKVDG